MLLCCVCVRGCQKSFKHGGTSVERLSHALNGSLVGKFHLSTFNIVSVLSTSLAVTCVVRQKFPVQRAWPFCASSFAYNPLPVCAKPDRKAWPSCASSFAYKFVQSQFRRLDPFCALLLLLFACIAWPFCAKPSS